MAPLHGICFEDTEICTVLFVDDVLVFSANPTSDMITIKNIFDKFRACSGLRINYDKSEILSLGTICKPSWISSSPFPIAKSFITYLGVKIGSTTSSIYALNYPPLIQKLVQELENWMELPLLLLGRCHLIKMVSFAHLLYPLQTKPLLLKHKDIQILKDVSPNLYGIRNALVYHYQNFIYPEARRVPNIFQISGSNLFFTHKPWLDLPILKLDS